MDDIDADSEESVKVYEIGSSEGFEEAERRIEVVLGGGKTVLDLSGLGLLELPLSASKISGLVHVCLGYPEAVRKKPKFARTKSDKKMCNAVKSLPASFLIANSKLATLDLDGNQLTALPPEIGGLASLEWLHLNGNQLTALPPEIGGLASLQGLDLNGNQLTALPPEIGGLASLEWLHLDGNQLTALPPEIGGLASLEWLHLDGNQLTALPPEIGGLASLEWLHLNGNQLTALPPEIGGLASLEWLDLDGNQLTALPPEIGGLASLATLHLNGNQLTALPPEIGGLALLQGLHLNGNQLTALPPEIGGLASLQGLHLNGNQLTALPPEIGGLASLQGLDLDGNQLTALPPEIGGLASLQGLDLDGNQLTALPPEIGGLASLQGLDLDGNQLTALPPEIGGLASLQGLDLDGNQLTALPPEIGGLASLEWLHLDGNQLTALPPEIGGLASLQGLDLNGNQLTALPPEIGGLASLQGLHLNGNQLTALPPEIGGLASLEWLDLDGNQLPETLMRALEEGGVSALFAAFRSIQRDHESIFEAKLLVTGEGKVGKSWALAALRGEDPQKSVGEDNTTYGVARGILPVPHPEHDGTDIQLNTWDFGGQKVYRITHQFFFSEDSVYLLVWNPRAGAEQCQVRQWLRRIDLRTGGNARVIMVATHSPKDSPQYLPDYGRDSLPEDLQGMIVDEISIDSDRGDNIQELRGMIAAHAAALPTMGEPFSPAWRAARDRALQFAIERPYLRYREFSSICSEEGIIDADEVFTLLRVFMHGLGKAIYYGNRQLENLTSNSEERRPLPFNDVQLADIVVLDAEWLSKAFVQVLEDEATNSAGGMLDHSRLDSIWRTHGRGDWQIYDVAEHPYLIRLMAAFDISYVVRGSGGEKSLVAQLVPGLPPPLPWRHNKLADDERDGVVRMVCRLGHEAPGLMARLTVQTAPYHVRTKVGRGLFWKEGVFLKEEAFGNEALISIEGTERPVLNVTVVGSQPGWFLGDLYRTVEQLFQFWPGLEKKYKIRCPAKRNDGSLCDGEFDFDFIVRQHKKSREKLHTCQNCDEEFTSAHLLEGFGSVTQERSSDVMEVQAKFLARTVEAPCPRAFLLEPVDWEMSHMLKRSGWDPVGKRLRITLLSEYSFKKTVSKEFKIYPGWVKAFFPIIRITALALTGAAVPMSGDVAVQLSEGASFMSNVAGLVPDSPLVDNPKSLHKKKGDDPPVAWVSGADLEVLDTFLKSQGLAPQFGGMKFAKIGGKYLWVTAEEAERHAEPEPKLTYVPNSNGSNSP